MKRKKYANYGGGERWMERPEKADELKIFFISVLLISIKA
jgi:hypothetical protein